MKGRISIVMAMGLCGLFAQAQPDTHYTGGTNFGIRMGVNFQNINGMDENGDKLDNEILTGFNVGFNAEIPVASQFYFQPGLLFTIKGAKDKEVILGETIKSKVRISYIELPLNLIYKPVLGKSRLLLGLGPYVAYGVGGKVKYKENGSSQKQEIKFKNTVKTADPDDEVYFRPLDAGVNMLAGYEFNDKVSVQLNTQLGLTKINPEYEGASGDKTSAKNTGFGFSLRYRL